MKNTSHFDELLEATFQQETFPNGKFMTSECYNQFQESLIMSLQNDKKEEPSIQLNSLLKALLTRLGE